MVRSPLHPPLLFHVKRSPLGVTDSCRVHIADSYSSWPWNGAAALWSCGALTCSPHVRRQRSTSGSSGLIGMHHPKAHSSTVVSRETRVLILPRDRAGRRVRPIARPRRLPWLHCASQHQRCGTTRIKDGDLQQLDNMLQALDARKGYIVDWASRYVQSLAKENDMDIHIGIPIRKRQ